MNPRTPSDVASSFDDHAAETNWNIKLLLSPNERFIVVDQDFDSREEKVIVSTLTVTSYHFVTQITTHTLGLHWSEKLFCLPESSIMC